MQDLKFGIEIEGASLYPNSFSTYRKGLQEKHDLNPIKIIRQSDGSATVKGHPSTHKQGREYKSSKPIPQEEIFEHIEHWNILLDDLKFMYNPKTCGTHIHISPLNDEWNGRYTPFIFNLFYSLLPFARFFKHRRTNKYCLGNNRYSKLIRFFNEDVNSNMTKDEFINQWKKSYHKSEIGFSDRNMLRVTSAYDTIEIRLLPSEVSFLDTMVQLIIKVWNIEGVLKGSDMIDRSIYEVLKMYSLNQDLYKFKNYYKEWLK